MRSCPCIALVDARSAGDEQLDQLLVAVVGGVPSRRVVASAERPLSSSMLTSGLRAEASARGRGVIALCRNVKAGRATARALADKLVDPLHEHHNNVLELQLSREGR